MPFTFLDPERPVTRTRGHLPHWDQEGVTYFITWRTRDSIPTELWEQWIADRRAWLCIHEIDSLDSDWRSQLEGLSSALRAEFHRTFSAKLEDDLDDCHGACVLRRGDVAQMVADSLRYFDGDRYTIGDFVVMPNHVHLLVGGMARNAMLKQVKSWKKWSALRINEVLGRGGRFWQDESFDHLVRNAASFERYRRYIAENPVKAKLREGEFLYWRRPEV